VVADGAPVYDGFYAEAKKLYEECVKGYGVKRMEKGWK